MDKNQAVKDIVKSRYFPFILLLLWELFFHLIAANQHLSDDVINAQVLSDQSLSDVLEYYYFHWASRVIINAVMIVLCTLPSYIWAVLNCAVIGIFLFSVSRLFAPKNSAKFNWVIAGLFLIYPYNHMNSAGWISTTVTYLWPITFGLYSCTLLKKDKNKWFDYLLCGAAMIYASNLEQISVIFSVLLFTLLIISICGKNKTMTARTAFLLLAALLGLVNHLTCPGNSERTLSEIAAWYPDFGMRTLTEKLQTGFMETMSNFFLAPNAVSIALSAVLMFIVWKKYKSAVCRSISGIPLFFCVGVVMVSSIVKRVFHGYDIFHVKISVRSFNRYDGLVNAENFRVWESYLPLFYMAVCFVIMGFVIFLCIDDLKKSVMAVMTYLCGIGSGMILGFSPTIYASNSRPYAPTFFCFIAVIIMVIAQNAELFNRKAKLIGGSLLYFAVMFNGYELVANTCAF